LQEGLGGIIQGTRLSGRVEMNTEREIWAVLMPGDRTRVANRIPNVHIEETFRPQSSLPIYNLETRQAIVALPKNVCDDRGVITVLLHRTLSMQTFRELLALPFSDRNCSLCCHIHMEWPVHPAQRNLTRPTIRSCT
jgi:hypothetical protein